MIRFMREMIHCRHLLWLLLLILLVGCGGRAQVKQSAVEGVAPGAAGNAEVVATARRVIGTPYHFGGATPEQGFDCSGLVQYSYSQAGLRAPRTVSQQKREARPRDLVNLQPGDLVFFDTRYKGGHVGIFAGSGQFIHAPSNGGRVRIDQLDDPYWRRRIVGTGALQQ